MSDTISVPLLRNGETTEDKLEIDKNTIPSAVVALGETLDGYDVEGREDILAEHETLLMLLQGKLFGAGAGTVEAKE